ncbi:MAG TPA: hypothetical protein VGS07_21340 [Thermoanaerobaculia bacterium]|jgi:hypothetical protein|nr:hypothetical protein [Thermoanaerobaculia bacterium]
MASIPEIQSSIQTGSPGDWVDLVALAGNDGRRWAEEYRQPACSQFLEMINRSLQLLRSRHLDSGIDLLASAHLLLLSMRDASAGLVYALERWRHSVTAYYYYCIDDLENAEDCLMKAQTAIQAAIETQTFLLWLAEHTCDFQLQRARIARNRRHWHEMRRHIQACRDMMKNRLPLCTLSDGTPIYIAAIDHFFRALPLTTEREKLALARLLDPCERHRQCQVTVDAIYALPGFVIPLL